jgi:multidrug efflux pump subunit AcrB
VFDRLSGGYGRLTGRLVRMGAVIILVYAGLIYVAYDRLAKTPTGLVPQLDRGYLIAAFQLPPGASLSRTDLVLRRASDIIMRRPGIEHAVAFAGFDGATFTNAPNAGVIFVVLKPAADRAKAGLGATSIVGDLYQQLGPLTDSFTFVLEPPSVPGIGTGGGLKGYVQDRAGRGLSALEGAAWAVAGTANATPGVTQAFTLFNTHTPQLYADIDRTKAELLGVPITQVFETLSDYMGSAYINDFNLLGRTYQVTAQADDPLTLSPRRRQ